MEQRWNDLAHYDDLQREQWEREERMDRVRDEQEERVLKAAPISARMRMLLHRMTEGDAA